MRVVLLAASNQPRCASCRMLYFVPNTNRAATRRVTTAATKGATEFLEVQTNFSLTSSGRDISIYFKRLAAKRWIFSVNNAVLKKMYWFRWSKSISYMCSGNVLIKRYEIFIPEYFCAMSEKREFHIRELEYLDLCFFLIFVFKSKYQFFDRKRRDYIDIN